MIEIGTKVRVVRGDWRYTEGHVLSLERDEVTVEPDGGGSFHAKLTDVEELPW